MEGSWGKRVEKSSKGRRGLLQKETFSGVPISFPYRVGVPVLPLGKGSLFSGWDIWEPGLPQGRLPSSVRRLEGVRVAEETGSGRTEVPLPRLPGERGRGPRGDPSGSKTTP